MAEQRYIFKQILVCPIFLVNVYLLLMTEIRMEQLTLKNFSMEWHSVCMNVSKDKCRLLFKIFNLDDDEGIMREELATVLSSALLSANAVLQSTLTQEEDKSEDTCEKVEDTVKGIVDDTFETCDTSRNGKLEIDEFVKWVHKNPKLVDNIFVIQCHTPSDHSGSFHMISTPDNAPESERIVSQHDTPAAVQTDENAQGPSSLIDLFRDTDTPVKDTEGKSFVDSIGTSKSDESLPKLQFEVTGVQKLGAIDTDNVESEIYLAPQGSEVAPNKLGQEGRTTPDQIESLQFGGITLDAKPLGSTEALWHPLKEPEMSESTESIETE